MNKKKYEEARKMLVNYIRERAEEQDITQEKIAERTGFLQPHISRVFAGRYSPSLDHLMAIAEAANCYIFVIDKNADDDLCDRCAIDGSAKGMNNKKRKPR